MSGVSLPAWKAIISIFYTLASLTTIFRLIWQYRWQRWWLDDTFALCSLLFDTVYFVSIWLRTLWFPSGDVESSPSQVQHRVLLFWFTAILSPCVVWSARISMGFLVSRFVSVGSNARRNLFVIWLFFGIIWLSIMLEKVLVCRSNSAVQMASYVHCTDGKSTGIISLCTDIVADAFLIAVPLCILWNINLRRGERQLILITLTSSVLSSMASIAYALVVFNTQRIGHNRGLAISLVAHIKASTTLIVCNLLNIVTFLYRLLRARHTEPDDTVSSLTLPPSVKPCSDATDNMMPASPSQNIVIYVHRLDATPSFFHDAGVWQTDVDHERSSLSVATGSHTGRANLTHSF